MKPWERWGYQIAVLLAAATGLLYGCAKYFGERPGEFGPEPHPWQGTLQHLHVLLVPGLVFATGWIVRSHALKSLADGKRERRASGWGLLVFAAPMILSGYLRQTSVGPLWQKLWTWAHIGFASIFSFTVIIHTGRRWLRFAAYQDLVISAKSSGLRGRISQQMSDEP